MRTTDGGCFKAPEASIAEEITNIVHPFAVDPIVDTTDKVVDPSIDTNDKSVSEKLDLMLVDMPAKHGVYTSDLKSDIMRWHQRHMYMYPERFSL